MCRSPVPLTNLINGPEASPLHRSIRLELDPEAVAGGSDWRHECTMTEFANKRRHLTVTISNLVIEKKKTSDQKSIAISYLSKIMITQEMINNKKGNYFTYV